MSLGTILGAIVLTLPLGVLGEETAPTTDLAAPPPATAYPWSGPEVNCVSRACGDFRLIDLDLRLTDIDRYQIGQRWQIGDRYYLDFESRIGDSSIDRSRLKDGDLFGDGVRVGFSAARWDTRAWSDGEQKGVAGEIRLPRWRLGLSASQRDADDGVASRLFVGFRVSPDMEVRAELAHDSLDEGSLGVGPRPSSAATLGLVWQPGPRTEWLVEASSARLQPVFGDEFDAETLRTTGTWTGRHAQFEGGLALERMGGRLESESGAFEGRVRTKLTRRLTAEVAGRFVEDFDLGSVGEGYGAGARWHARPFVFLRAGRSGAAVDRLVREAFRLGYNELRTFDEDGLLLLRERLRVSRAPGDALDQLVSDVYRATIAERNVELFGFDWNVERDHLREDELTEWSGFVAFPWPLRPWLGLNPDRLDFLRLTYVRRERQVSSGLTRRGSRIELLAELNREFVAVLAWDEPAPTALELTLGAEAPPRLEASLRYRFRR